MKKFLKILLIVLAVILAAVCALLIWLTVTEYKPAPAEDVAVTGEASAGKLDAGEPIDVLSWNIGYAALGKEADSFLDGGKMVRGESREKVEEYLRGICSTIDGYDYDVLMLQEVDQGSDRACGVEELPYFDFGRCAYGLNYLTPFVPYPVPPIGRVCSGLFVSTEHEMDSAERIALPCPFKWPVSTVNLKRCLLACRMPLEGSDRELVMVNLHLEAYDDGEGKIAQTALLIDFIRGEYEKGNYVIAGGDFNQRFPGSPELYPNYHADDWEPGILSDDDLPEDYRYVCDLSYPSCRLLNQPYDPADTEGTQYHVIDGFILSPNVELVSVETQRCDFEFSDHNPVLLRVNLK